MLIFQYRSGVGTASPVWMTTLQHSNFDRSYDVRVDSSGNSYVIGETRATGTQDALLAKFTSTGALDWQRTIGGTGTEEGYGLDLDSSDNPHIILETNSPGGAGNYDAVLAKYNSSGAIQWHRAFGDSTYNIARAVAVDSSGNVFIGTSQSTNSSMIIAQYDSSGTIQWQFNINGAGNEYIHDVAVDSSGNAYYWGQTTTSGGTSWNFFLMKVNSSGSIQWQRTLGGPGSDQSSSTLPNKMYVDASGNVYIIGTTNNDGSISGFNRIITAKYDTNGTIQWQRSWGHDGVIETASINVGGVTADTSGNVYVCASGSGGWSVGTGGNIMLMKYNSSGVVQWQRSIGGDSGTTAMAGNNIAAHGSSIYITGGQTTVTNSTDFLIAKVPDDGSGIDTYTGVTNIYYQDIGSEASLVEQASTLTDASASLSSSISTFTDQAGSLTDQAGTMTEVNIIS